MDQSTTNLPLTRRQTEILKLIQAGCSNKEVARRLEISDGTVKQHLVEIYRRLRVNNRTKAAQLVTRAEEPSLFIESRHDPEPQRITRTQQPVATPVFAAVIQRLTCMRVRIPDALALLHEVGSERFDRLNRRILQECEHAARRMEGVVQGSIEGPLVLFGVGGAREDDPVRAVCCAWLVTRAMEQCTEELGLTGTPIRIAVATGEAITRGVGKHMIIQGDAGTFLSLASDTGGQAVVLTPATRQALDRWMARYGEPFGHIPGCGHPRDAERMSDDPPPFVGRESELEQLLDQLGRARQGESKAMLLVGEAGFGKSRLARELRARSVPMWEVLWVIGGCHSLARTIPLHPFLPVMEKLAGCDPAAPESARRSVLERWVQGLAPSLAGTGLRALALAREEEAWSGLRSGDPLIENLSEFFASVLLAAHPVVVLCLDNLQWMDPCTRVLLPVLANRLNGSHVWLLGVGRKAELRAFAQPADWRTLALSRFSDREIDLLLHALPIARRLDATHFQTIREWCRGVPLFAVEIAEYLAGFKKSVIPTMIGRCDLVSDSLACMVLERLQAVVGVDWKLLRLLAAGEREMTLEQLLARNPHGDSGATEAVVNHLATAGILRIEAQGERRFVAFGNEMVRAAIRKTLPVSDLTG
ncbi:MAG: AAA family ATPase [Magnetococcales bacterium]|nr:AAA family ATPase [Magnetococcales bacterium]